MNREDKMRSRGPTRAPARWGPACANWPKGKLLTYFWRKKTSNGEFYSGSRRTVGPIRNPWNSPTLTSEKERTKSQYSEQVKTSMPALWPLVIITDLILTKIPDWNSLSETLSKNDKTRKEDNDPEMITMTILDETPTAVLWQDNAARPPTRNVTPSSWHPSHHQPHRWEKINNFLNNGVGKFSDKTNKITRFTKPSQDMPDKLLTC